MTLEEWKEEKDRELDASLTALFQSVESPEPPSGFASRTMKAVRQAPLPTGRQALSRPWTRPLGWAGIVVAAAALVAGAMVNQPAIAEALASFVAIGIRVGMWLLGSVHTTSAIFGLLATAGGVFARAMSTREATAGLTLLTAVAVLSLSMLNRLLFSEKESSSW